MIKGIGIDICDIKRLEKVIKNNRAFLKRVYSPAEIMYCSGKKRPGIHYAGRFAVKEAFIKALSTDKSIPLNAIEVKNDVHGKPSLVITPRIRAALKKKNAVRLEVSISHTHTSAAAVCIISG
ncbi:MAG: holo-ACP synthase [Spirochaetia bacterium]|nr:holo-ACP synthase [Spirochaetia bacterium]